MVTAVGLVAEIGDLRRLEHPRKLMGYLGLVPSEASSGERVHRGSITKTGNAHARRLLTEAARLHLLAEGRGRRGSYPEEGTISGLFAAQAARTPTAVAVVAGEEELTYGELDQRSNAFAHFLRDAGLRQVDVVAVLMDRNTRFH